MKSNWDIIWLDSVDSTNDEAKRRISDLDNLSVLSTLSQTKGRGQGDHIWLSEPGSNLLFSIILKYSSSADAVQSPLLSVQAHDQIVISQITALSVVDLLAAHDIDAKIKLPNDIYVGDKKICGVLIENSLRGEHLSSSIIGIGLNVNQRNFDVNLPNPTSMALETGLQEDIKECLEEFMDIFQNILFAALSSDHNLRDSYLSHLWRRNISAQFLDLTGQGSYECQHLGREFRGIIRSVSPIGHLLLEDTEKGELKEFAFKEISYIL